MFTWDFGGIVRMGFETQEGIGSRERLPIFCLEEGVVREAEPTAVFRLYRCGEIAVRKEKFCCGERRSRAV